MINIPDELPVPKNHTMEIVDSSKVQAFMDCPRGFFFNYVLGFRSDSSNVHLDFGSAWHDAMEQLLLGGYSQENVEKAFFMFLKTYREAFPDEMTDGDNEPKNPEFAYKALKMYAKQYEKDNFKVLYTETAGLVPISETRSMVVKLDSILEDLNISEVNSMEHKTTGRNSASWRDKWSIMIQPAAYTHLLYMLYPEKVGKVIINGSVFTKSKVWEGVRIPVYKSKLNMRAFLWEVNHWIDQIEWNYQALAKQDPEADVMEAFPINCMSCSKFGCRMNGLCSAIPNPIKRFVRTEREGGAPVLVSKPPSGSVVDFWDPLRENLSKADNVIKQDADGKLTVEPKKEESEE